MVATNDLPAISSSAYVSVAYDPSNWNLSETVNTKPLLAAADVFEALKRKAQATRGLTAANFVKAGLIQPQEEDTVMARRLVQVVVADPDENVPLDQALIYEGKPKFTDATDQELYFELDIQALLKKHNEARVKIVNKKVKERTEYLEPARVRELKMVVVTIATF